MSDTAGPRAQTLGKGTVRLHCFRILVGRCARLSENGTSHAYPLSTNCVLEGDVRVGAEHEIREHQTGVTAQSDWPRFINWERVNLALGA